MKFTTNRKPRVTLLEAMMVLIVGALSVGLVMTNMATKKATNLVHGYDADIDFRSRNFHNLMRRDILLASSMEGPFDSAPAVEVRGDTLIIRFADLDSVRYFLDRSDESISIGKIYREDVPIIDNVLFFDITYDTITVDVSMVVAARDTHPWVNNGELYNRKYEWVTVLNNSQVRE